MDCASGDGFPADSSRIVGNVQLVRKVYERKIEPVMKSCGFDLSVSIEGDADIYEACGLWAERLHEHGSENHLGRIRVSGRALMELSGKALEGLLCHHAGALLHIREVTRGDKGELFYIMSNVNPACLEVSFDERQRDCFGTEALPPFRYETANIDVRNIGENRFPLSLEEYLGFYNAYLNRSGYVMPDVAAEIMRNLQFSQLLDWGEPVAISSGRG